MTNLENNPSSASASIGMKFSYLAFFILAVLSGHSSIFAKDLQPELNERVNSVYKSIVRIEVVSESGSNGRMLKSGSTGSGVIFDQSGLVLTNHHVAGKAKRLKCRLYDGEEISAFLIGADALTDLAVIRLNLEQRVKNTLPLQVATFGDSESLEVGDPCFAMGSPAGLSQSVTRGIISNLALISTRRGSFRLDGENVGELVRWLGHDAIIYPGNSGGPLVNLEGEIIGINEVAIASLGGAIPSNLAKSIAWELAEHGSINRSWSGLELQPLLSGFSNGVLVAGIIENSPAQKAGFKPGDLITQIGNKPVTARIEEDLPPIHQLLSSFSSDKPFPVNGKRGPQNHSWEIIPVKREPAFLPETDLKSWGITLRNFSLLSSLESRRESKVGAQVHSVAQGGPSFLCKPSLSSGDVIVEVNGVAITSAEQLIEFSQNLIHGKEEASPVLVRFERDQASIITVVQIGPEPFEKRPVEAWKAWLGVGTQVITPELIEALKLKPNTSGIRLTQIFKNTPAHRSGLKAGDLLFKIDGQVIQARKPEDIEVFGNMIKQYRTDSTIQLTGLREGLPLEINATLDKRPTPSVELPSHEEKFMEFTVRELSFADRAFHRLPAESPGLIVENVELAGWASLAGLKQGDILLRINEKEIGSVDEFKSTLKNISDQKESSVTLFIQRGIHTLFIEIEPDWKNS